MSRTLSREDAWNLLAEWVESPSLRRHCLAVEAAVVAYAEQDGLDAAETEEMKTALGAGGTGKGTAQAQRSARAAEKDLEKKQKSRLTRTKRDALDRALVDLAGYYRDVLVRGVGASVTSTHPDRATEIGNAARDSTPESSLRRLEAILACRDALAANVKPEIAIDALVTALRAG